MWYQVLSFISGKWERMRESISLADIVAEYQMLEYEHGYESRIIRFNRAGIRQSYRREDLI